MKSKSTFAVLTPAGLLLIILGVLVTLIASLPLGLIVMVGFAIFHATYSVVPAIGFVVAWVGVSMIQLIIVTPIAKAVANRLQ